MAMIARFIIYPLNHTILAIDVSEIGLPSGIYPPDGDLKMVPSLRFHNWRFAEAYFLKKGAKAEVISKISALVDKGSMAELTIV
jgi:hypothetical protein